MDTTIPCPGCRTTLNLNDSSCPVCLRGRSGQEIARGFAQAREKEARRRKRPWIILAWLAIIAGIGGALFAFREPIEEFAQTVGAKLGRFYDQNSDATYIAPHYKRPEPADPTKEKAPAPATFVPSGPAVARPPQLSPAVPAREPALPHVSSSEWLLHGRAYDLSTLKPLGGARLQVKIGDAGGPTAATNPDGYYVFVLPLPDSKDPGYSIQNLDPRYAAVAQYEADIPYRRLSRGEREHLIENAREDEVQPGPLSEVAGAEGLSRDVFLSPRR